MITVKQYIKDEDLLETYYVPYLRKCEFVDVLLSSFTDKIDFAIAKYLLNIVFVSSCTNIDMENLDDDGLNGYDSLAKQDYFDELFNDNSLASQYSEYYEIFEDKVRTWQKK